MLVLIRKMPSLHCGIVSGKVKEDWTASRHAYVYFARNDIVDRANTILRPPALPPFNLYRPAGLLLEVAGIEGQSTMSR